MSLFAVSFLKCPLKFPRNNCEHFLSSSLSQMFLATKLALLILFNLAAIFRDYYNKHQEKLHNSEIGHIKAPIYHSVYRPAKFQVDRDEIDYQQNEHTNNVDGAHGDNHQQQVFLVEDDQKEKSDLSWPLLGLLILPVLFAVLCFPILMTFFTNLLSQLNSMQGLMGQAYLVLQTLQQQNLLGTNINPGLLDDNLIRKMSLKFEQPPVNSNASSLYYHSS